MKRVIKASQTFTVLADFGGQIVPIGNYRTLDEATSACKSNSFDKSKFPNETQNKSLVRYIINDSKGKTIKSIKI